MGDAGVSEHRASPKRIQRRRTRGWRMPEGAVYVGRPTKWGNPFTVGSAVTVSGTDADGLFFDCVQVEIDAAMAVAMFRDVMIGRLSDSASDHPDDLAYSQRWRANVQELGGRDLACWCPLGQPCHADVLLEIANSAA